MDGNGRYTCGGRARAHGQCGVCARPTSHTPNNESCSASLRLMLEVLKLML